MKSIKIALAATAATLAMSGAAFAQDSAPDVSINLGVSSDYVFRGVSQTDENPQIFGGLDVSKGMFYAGAWASNVDFNNGTDAEIDFYAGIKPQAGPVSLDFGALYYSYVNSPSGSNQSYWEFKAAGSMPIGPATLGAAVYYSPEFFGKTGEALYYEVNGSMPINEKLSVSAAIGHQDVDYAGDYNTWNLGLGYAFNDKVGIDVRYHDTDEHGYGDIYDSRAVVSLKTVF